MIEGLNTVFDKLQCAHVINFGKCFPNEQDAGKNEHITLEEMDRGETQSHKRMLKYMKNKSLVWPEEFSTPGHIWAHSYKQSTFNFDFVDDRLILRHLSTGISIHRIGEQASRKRG